MWRVQLTVSARQDLLDIHRYLAVEAGRATADDFVERLAERGAGLSHFPDRGVAVDLPVNGVRVRSVLVAPYRLFYRAQEGVVTIFAVLHTRREIAALLEERLGR